MMKKKSNRIVTIFSMIAMLVVSAITKADTIIYGSSADTNELVRINVTSSSVSSEGYLAVGSKALDLDVLDNRLYYFEWGASADEFSYWDIATGNETIVRLFNPSPQKLITGMAVAPDGQLFAIDDQDGVYLLDKSNGTVSYRGDVSGLSSVAGDFAFSPDATTYMVADTNLYSVSTSNLNSTLLYGDLISGLVSWSGLSFCDGVLYATDIDATTQQSSLYRIDPDTGAVAPLFQMNRKIDDLSVCIDLDLSPNNFPVAFDDAYSVNEDAMLNIVADGVLANDDDLDGDSLSALLIGTAENGVASLNPDGSFSYQPNQDFAGSDSFTYVANDGRDDSNLATVFITVNAVNEAPIADSLSVSTFENSDLDITLTANDPENDPLTYSLVAQPLKGSLSGDIPDVVYTPNVGFVGADHFTFLASDAELDSNIAVITISVTDFNNVPTAANDSYLLDEDEELVVPVNGVLGNDDDADGDPLTAVLQSLPQNGLVTFNGDGSFNYLPNPEFSGNDSFSYLANDSQASSNIATVLLTINPVNDAPVAADDNYNVSINGGLDAAASGVLGNDFDVEGDALQSSVVAPPFGDLVLNSDGSFTYSPQPDYLGIDFFTYEAFDGGETSNTATVTFEIGDVDIIIYGSNRHGDMIELDLTANTFSYVSSLAVGTQAMDQDFTTPDNLVYYYELGFSGDEFMNWNPVTGVNTLIKKFSPSPGKYGKRMAIDPDGTLYLMDSNDVLYTFDKITGDASTIGKVTGLVTGEFGGTGDFTFTPDGTLYLVTYENLYTIDINTLSATLLYSDMIDEELGMTVVWTGVAYCDGMIYASHVETQNGISAMFSIDPGTGLVTEMFYLNTFLNDLTSCATTP